MAILSADKLVVVKAFAPANPLPLDAREIYDSLAEAQAYAKSSAVAYAGQTVKVVEDGTVTVFTLVPSEAEDTNFELQFVGGGAGGVQTVATSATEGNIAVTVADGDSFKTVNVPVVGALVNPVVDEDEHTLTLTKLGATAADNAEVVIPLGGASPADIVSKIELGTDGTSVKVTYFNVEAETESTTDITLKNVVTGVAHTAATETSSAKTVFNFKDADGAAQTVTAFAEGVQKVVAGSTVNKLAITVAGADGALTTTEIQIGTGSVQNPTYNSDDRIITLPVLKADGTTENLVIDLGKDMVVKSGVYNTETKEIELTLTDGSVIKIPAVNLVDIYTGESTATATVAVSADNKITAQVKISTVEKNILKSDENGLYVVEADFVDTKKLITDAQAAAEKHADDELAAAVETLEGAIADAQAAAEKHADDELAAAKEELEGAIADAQAAAEKHADDELAAAVEALEGADATNLQAAKDYSDGKLAEKATELGTAITNAETAAKSYADGIVGAETTARGQAIADAVADMEDYADEKMEAEVEARNQAIADSEAAAKKYADDQIAAKITENNQSTVADALAQAKKYADDQDAIALQAAKDYADDELDAAKEEIAGNLATAVQTLEGADATNLQAAKDYADAQDATNLQAAKDFAAAQDATNLQAAKDFADAQDVILKAALEAADATNLQAAKDYSDGKLATAVQTLEQADATNLQAAKDYADGKDATNLQAAKDYADGKDATLKAELVAADATNLQAAKDYSDGKLATAVQTLEGADATNLQAAKDYADAQDVILKAALEQADATNLQAAKDYADAQDVINLAAAKSYTDTQIEAAKTKWVDFGTQV